VARGSVYVAKKPLLSGGVIEKTIEELNWLDRLIFTSVYLVKNLWHKSSRRDKRLSQKIIERSEELSQSIDEELYGLLTALRKRLCCQTLNDALIIESFAIIREISGRVLQMRHHHTQIRAAIAMLRGEVAEMATGEGKTLAATLAASTAALMGIPVHIVSVNDYLTERDGEEMSLLYQALGLSVGIINHDMEMPERRTAYHCDITYCSNKELVFDYLKDRIARGDKLTNPAFQRAMSSSPEIALNMMQRGYHFAIIDEADSIFVDEARTPLIISGEEKFGDKEETLLRTAMKLANSLTIENHFLVNEHGGVQLTVQGELTVRELAIVHGGLWLSREFRESLIIQGLSAIHRYHRNKHYIVNEENEVQIVDAYTGRVTPGRSWGQGLHQMIEIKEGLELTKPRETKVEISYQNFFRKYFTLSGMTGTCFEVKKELRDVFRVDCSAIPLLKKSKRKRLNVTVDSKLSDKVVRITNYVKSLHLSGVPVLIGTATVSASEALAESFALAGLNYKVLNARQDKEEAEIIANAGQFGALTIATGIAGRGTDIKLSQQAKAAGGLHVVITELQDSSRIDRQFYGRSARQGDPGSYSLMLSLEDDILIRVFQPTIRRVLVSVVNAKFLRNKLGYGLLRFCQYRLEKLHYKQRLQLLASDIKRQRMLSFSGKSEYD
jgi:preprotein translocase subunit SecA